ncbi:sodium/calcium exchanger membrane region [Haliangium ochraceum DSM 14365]|uniref:Sodium/calcium exchanger membrane region n=2 Tax=Haliangium ochraceum TaxID=80816 RepID=D0LQZ2_HALO1|nr:sodium/calcium exchanger membrane region [Haliangium ochraceum DSM 14365]
MPELVTSVEAALMNAPGIAWGNVVGSNIANTLLILGVASFIMPFAVDRRALWRDGGVGLGAAAVLIGVAAVLGGPGRLGGALFFITLCGYVVFAYRQERLATTQESGVERMAEASPPASRARAGGYLAAVGLTLAGLGTLIVGGRLLVSGAIELARLYGLSETLIGLTVVAVGTSLPELVTSVIAAIRGHAAVAFGNVTGSNIYNLLGIGGFTAVVAPAPLPEALRMFDLPALLATSLLLLLLPAWDCRLGRARGALLVAAYAGYLAMLVVRAT